jgi:ATP-dependent Clp protease ATP-binding subunit ClpB
LFRVTQPAREFLLKEGTDMKYGARHWKRAIERYVVYPLAILLATEQVSSGDVISIDWHGGELGLTFLKEAEGAQIPMPAPAVERPCEGPAAISAARSSPMPSERALGERFTVRPIR